MVNEQQSGKMWSGRFREPLDDEFEAWQRSIVFDWRLLIEEIAASKAHASALCEAQILTRDETTELRAALDAIASEHASDAGKAAVRDHATAEDIHHFVELALVERVGSLGLKLHTGRSRNEQIATDLRLYVRSQIKRVIDSLAAWARALVEQAARRRRRRHAQLHPSATGRTGAGCALAAGLCRDDSARRRASP